MATCSADYAKPNVIMLQFDCDFKIKHTLMSMLNNFISFFDQSQVKAHEMKHATWLN